MPKIGEGEISIPLEEFYYLGKAIFKDVFTAKEKPLNYDTPWLLKYYYNTSNGENILRSRDRSLTAPYEIAFDFRESPIYDWGTFRYVGEFELTNELAVVRERLIKIFEDKGLLHKGNAICPRISKIITGKNNLLIEIQKANYYDQVATNLSLDYSLSKIGDELTGVKTLREWDLKQSKTNPGLLPSLSKSKLANTIGVAVGITAINKKGEKIILTRQKTKNVAVSAKMTVLPFSFSLNMDKKGMTIGKESSIFDLIKADFRNEQLEELGLEPDVLDFEKVKPLLLCRELCRGGKPQFFFELELDIPFEDLKKQIKEVTPSKKEFKNKIEGITIEKARKSLNKFSPELRAFITAKC